MNQSPEDAAELAILAGIYDDPDATFSVLDATYFKEDLFQDIRNRDLYRSFGRVHRQGQANWDLIALLEDFKASAPKRSKPLGPEELKTLNGIIEPWKGTKPSLLENIQILIDRFEKQQAQAKRQMVVLFGKDGNGGIVSITDCAAEVYGLARPAQKLFMRGGEVVMVQKTSDGNASLAKLEASTARSHFELYAEFFKWGVDQNGKPVMRPAILSLDDAKALVDCETAKEKLHEVCGLSACPIIVATEDGLKVQAEGYCQSLKLLITRHGKVNEIPVAEAKKTLQELVSEIDFQTPGDRSRALASIITLALKMGGHIKGPVPIDIAEADQSQSGKTYRQKVTAAVYGEQLTTITQKTGGGVGSLDESFASALIGGRPLILLDNFRGRIDSQNIEGFMTAEGTAFQARAPHKGSVGIDSGKFFVFASSNGVSTTKDLANRASFVRIRKRTGHTFKTYTEGDLLAHVRARQPYFLGAVFAIIREWYRLGCQKTNDTRHDFREWAQKLDWIMQNIMGEAALMEGHESAQQRVSDTHATMLRELCLAVENAGRMRERLSPVALAEIAADYEVSIPRLPFNSDNVAAAKQLGNSFKKLFQAHKEVKASIEVDGYQFYRMPDVRPTSDGKVFESKCYVVDR